MKRINLILPIIFFIGLAGTFAAISSLALKIFLIISSLILLYLYIVYRQIFREVFTLAAALFAAVTVNALNFFFTPPWYLTTLLYLLLVFFLFLQALGVTLYALLGSLILVEIFWATLFWPVHFLTAAVVNFLGFYALYMLSALYFEGKLTRKKIYFHMGIILVVLTVSLLSSPWQPK